MKTIIILLLMTSIGIAGEAYFDSCDKLIKIVKPITETCITNKNVPEYQKEITELKSHIDLLARNQVYLQDREEKTLQVIKAMQYEMDVLTEAIKKG